MRTPKRPGSSSNHSGSWLLNMSRKVCCTVMPTPARAGVPGDHHEVVPGMAVKAFSVPGELWVSLKITKSRPTSNCCRYCRFAT